jgi:hypothetical protein
MQYLCMPCSLEHGRFVQQRLKSAPPNLSQQEQLAAIRTINIEADKHMKQWISEGGSQ